MIPLDLTWCTRGDIIDVVNEIAQTTEPIMVFSPCTLATKGYYCASCKRHIANIGNLLMHIEAGGVHRIAVWCQAHRLYEAAEQSQIAAFAKLTDGMNQTELREEVTS